MINDAGSLVCTFLAHKAALYCALFVSPQFDTSSRFVFNSSNWQSKLARRLVVWDNVYYTAIVERGVLFEHELAFSRAWTLLTGICLRPVPREFAPLVIAMMSLLCHAIACVALRSLVLLQTKSKRLAYLCTMLYISSPAGIFLINGYPESIVAALSFIGLTYFEKGRQSRNLLFYLLAAIFFAVATLFRSNALLWGAAFFIEMLLAAYRRQNSLFLMSILGGSLIGLAFIVPQILYWFMYCPGRPWCDSPLPLVYGYVQRHYWNVGFLRYWTPNNISNFLFAAPSLILLFRASARTPVYLAGVQLLYIIGALFFWHVQIITRISSCLPGPYLYVARLIESKNFEGKLCAAYFIIWSIMQAVLFGAFLPPA